MTAFQNGILTGAAFALLAELAIGFALALVLTLQGAPTREEMRRIALKADVGRDSWGKP